MSLPIYQFQTASGRFATFTFKPAFPYKEVHQVHGVNVVNVDQASRNIDADGIWAVHGNATALAIKTADCLPILVYGEVGVAMLHAGWKGVAHGIIANQHVADLKPKFFVIGPYIHGKHYEVSPGFEENFSSAAGISRHENRYTLELVDQIRVQVKNLYGNLTVISEAPDTYSSPELHSYRRDKTTERNYNVWIPGSSLHAIIP